MLNFGMFYLALYLIGSTVAPDPEFKEQIVDDDVAIGYGLAIGDVDGDGKDDILLADKKQFVWYRNGDWTRFVMTENLTEADNVCLAARDINGDGKVEVAVGAQWNPGETTDPKKSGSVHYLVRPGDPTQRWTPVQLHNEPTVHRMHWVKADEGEYQLVVLPLHGRGNRGGEGAGVKVIAYEMTSGPNAPWRTTTIDELMHLTHNFDIVDNGVNESLYIGGKEGVRILTCVKGRWSASQGNGWFVQGRSFGEIRSGAIDGRQFVTGIEPMHGNELTVYEVNSSDGSVERHVLTSELRQGHALATADFLDLGSDQVVVGWREPNEENKVGLKLFALQDGEWKSYWVDDNGMACEDLKVADLDGDGKEDIIAAGRDSHNLKIYWNRN